MPFEDGIYYYRLNKFGFVEFDSLEDAEAGYDECINLVLSQTRWVLDNLDYIKEFEVPWLNYASKETAARYKRVYALSKPRVVREKSEK